jgi:hypothetical protein
MNHYKCPCCGFLTLDEEPPGTFAICPVCFWEDDNLQFEDPDYKGGANEESLHEAQKKFREIGASSENYLKNVRKSRPDETP